MHALLCLLCLAESTSPAKASTDAQSQGQYRKCEHMHIYSQKIIDMHAVLFRDEDTVPGMMFSEIARSASITDEEAKFDFKEELGIYLSIAENSISEDENVELFVLPAFSGPFAGPEGLEPVSPAYLIKSDKEIRFKKDVTLQIQHNACVVTERDCEDLVFMRASSIPLQRGPLFGPLYVFHEVNRSKGMFSLDDKQFGEVKTDQFSLFMIWRNLWRKVEGEGNYDCPEINNSNPLPSRPW